MARDYTISEDYIEKIESTDEEKRRRDMYSSGMLLWRMFKLAGDDLGEKLQAVN